MWKDEPGEFQQNEMLNLASGEAFQLREPLGWNNRLKWLVTDYCLSNSKVTKTKSSGHWQRFGLDNLIIDTVCSLVVDSHATVFRSALAMHNFGAYRMNRNKIIMQKYIQHSWKYQALIYSGMEHNVNMVMFQEL